MTCTECGNKQAYAMKYYESGCCCDRCGNFKPKGIPDVYFNTPYMDPNLAHKNRPWEKDGVLVTSKRHKARLMAEQNLVEAGDKKHGSRNIEKRIKRG